MSVITQAALLIRKAAGVAIPFPGFGGQSWYGGSGGWTWPLRQIGEREYRALVGNGEDSSIVTACVNWVANQAIQAIPAVRRYKVDDALGSYVRGHPAAQVVLHPTFDARIGQSFYSWISLIKATIISIVVDGNAFWLKWRSGSGRVVMLWFVPSWMMRPRWPLDGSAFISHYDYLPAGSTSSIPLLPSEVVHFRDGIDPNNTRLGLSQLKTLLREIFTDEEAARWTASLLKNQAVPGIVVAPGAGGGIPGPEDVKEIKARFMAEFTGDHRGEPIVMSGPTTIEQYGYSPEQMKLGDLRDIPEERVSAVIGVPAAVAGLGTGLQTAKVGATMGELVDLGWMNGVTPRHRILATTMTEQLLPDFDQGEDDEFEFDTTRVPIMADYHKKIAETHQQNYRWGVELRGEARRALAMPAGPDDDVHVLQSGASLVRPNGDVVSGKDTALANEPLAPEDHAAADALAAGDQATSDALAVDAGRPPLALGPGKRMRRLATIKRLAMRDLWTCCLCKTEILEDEPWPSVFAPTIDHIIPKSLGGTDDESNLRLVHFGCNSNRGAAKREQTAPPGFHLTPRQTDIARLLAVGMPNKQIAHRMGLSERTVERVLAVITQKLALDGRESIVEWAQEHFEPA